MVKTLHDVVARSHTKVVNASCLVRCVPRTGLPTSLMFYARKGFEPAPLGFPMEWVETCEPAPNLVSDQKEPIKMKVFAIRNHFGRNNATAEELVNRVYMHGAYIDLGKHFIEMRDRIRKLEAELGFCFTCGKMYEHEIDAPFASCDCGTSEWNKLTPYMKLQQQLFNQNSQKEQK